MERPQSSSFFAAQTSTTFIIPNLHCPSCVSHIAESLAALRPQPLHVSHSTINHTVTVVHPQSLDVLTITTALDDAGFEVYDYGDSRTNRFRHYSLNRSSFNNALNHAIQVWTSDSPEVESRKRKRHLENCEACRAQNKSRLSRSSIDKPAAQTAQKSFQRPQVSTNSLPDSKRASSFVVVDQNRNAPASFQATIAITGMTCSSCTGGVTKALESEPWVQEVNVSLLTHSASVVFHGSDNRSKLVDIIEDIGFNAVLQQVVPGQLHPAPTSDVWTASYAVEGMTCSTCVGAVTRALQTQEWVRTVDVNLISNSATVTFDGKDHTDQIIELIEDVGFDATLDKVRVAGVGQAGTLLRTVSIMVEGMYCESCPARVRRALEVIEGVTITKQPTVDDPLVEIQYRPRPPQLTIRSILQAMEQVDPKLSPSIYHATTLEERSRQMQTQERTHILYRLILSVVIAIPTFIIGIVYMSLVSSQNAGRSYLMSPLSGVSRGSWAMFVLATPVYLFAADIFHQRTIKELRALWRPGSPVPITRRFYRFGSMNMLISFGTSIAYWSSIAELAVEATHPGLSSSDASTPTYFDSVVFLTMFLLIGRLIEAYSKAKTGDAITALGKLKPNTALLVEDAADGIKGASMIATTREVPVDMIEVGDSVRVLSGASPPCDGVVIAGTSKFDESSLTGESKPVTKTEGTDVYTGTVNKGSPLTLRVTGTSGTSMLDKIVSVVREGQAKRAPVERTADLLTGYFVPFITAIAISTWVIWLSLGVSGVLPKDYLDVGVGGWAFWSLQFAIAVFVVACPCGLGLAAPTALFVGGGLAAKQGILVKGGGEAFQEASRIDVVAFDKTGTLTQGGEPKITDHVLIGMGEPLSEDAKVGLAMVYKLEQDSSHPIAKALVDFCSDSAASSRLQIQEAQEIPGRGMKGSFMPSGTNGTTVEIIIGNESLMKDHRVVIKKEYITLLDQWKSSGNSVVLAAARLVQSKETVQNQSWRLGAMFAASDPLRPESKSVVSALRSRGVDVWMISGDNPTTARAVGSQVGIPPDNIIAGVLPHEKADKVHYLQKSLTAKQGMNIPGSKTPRSTRRAIVAMVGDGINDSPALTMADVGIAIGSGSDVAISSAKFVLVSANLTSVLTLIDLSRAVFGRVKLNFAWALCYNMIALPIAAGVLYPIKSDGSHVRLDPVWAALAMALSSVSVICSSLLLRSRLPILGFRIKHNETANVA